MKILNGICGSSGYASGYAALKRPSKVIPKKYEIRDPAGEERRFRSAQSACGARMEAFLKESGGVNPEVSEIFKAYLTILNDDVFFQKAFKRVAAEKLNIEYLLYDECEAVVAKFAAFDDPYLKERAADIENVCGELIRAMLGIEQDFAINMMAADVVVVADDLTPSETMKMDKSRLRGFVTEKGGITSHTVILAKALGIPAIIGVNGALEAVSQGSPLLLDAFAGSVTVDPDEERRAAFQLQCESFRKRRELYERGAGEKAVTPDGYAISVNVNAGDAESIRAFDPDKYDGIGLLRTEFLYMGHDDYPGEEEQYAIYSEFAKKAAGKEVIIRTLESDRIRTLYQKKWYPESLYLLAMVDYLSRENDLPVCTEYDDIRRARLRSPLYPASVISMSAFSRSEQPKQDSYAGAIPEFIRFNIVEGDVRNVN